MKKLSIEQKAKAYDEAIERAKKWYNAPNIDKMPTYGNRVIEEIFPELKESEGEEIRKDIISYIKAIANNENISPDSKKECKTWIAWLEKQGEQKANYTTIVETGDGGINAVVTEELSTDKVEPKFKVGDKIRIKTPSTFDKDMQVARIEKDYYICNHIGKFSSEVVLFSEQSGYELIEQNLANNIEPMFKVGDWVIVHNKDAYQVIGVNTYDYRLQHYLGGKMNYPFKYESDLKPWTIQDAKDGDVLVDKSDGTIGIFQSIGHHPDGGSYNDPSYCFLHCRYDDGYFYADFENGNTMGSFYAIPATKEQRDLLFQKMHEAGYEWDAEKKELKKIEQRMVSAEAKEAMYSKPVEWSEKDEYNYNTILHHLDLRKEKYKKECNQEEQDRYQGLYDWLKSIRPQTTWKPTAIQMTVLQNAASDNTLSCEDLNTLSELYEQLKKL